MSNIPKIRIAPNRFLKPMFNAYARETNTEPEIGLEKANAEVHEKVEVQKAQWSVEEEKVLRGIVEATRLSFQESVVPVYIVPAYTGAFSDPIVISSLQQKQFADVLTHELIHRIGEQNNEGVSASAVSKEMFPEYDDRKITNHIFVHAIHQYIYLDVLQDEQRLATMIEKHSQWDAYKTAWNVVQERGYQTLVEHYRTAFKRQTST